MKVLWVGADEVTRKEDVEHTSDEGHLLHGGHRLCIFPSLVHAVDIVAHASLVLVKLLIGSWDPPAPFFHDLVLRSDTSVSELFLLLPHLFCVKLEGVLQTF